MCVCVYIYIGRYRSKDGDVYEGKFHNGERQGVGKYAPNSLLLLVACVSIRPHTSAYTYVPGGSMRLVVLYSFSSPTSSLRHRFSEVRAQV